VRWAKVKSGKKGYVVGQGNIAPKLGVIFETPGGGRFDVAKNDEIRKIAYMYHGHLATGTGADPVFEIV
ncbi:MAG: hypothetical protein P4L69_13440, partial [Desulfosporosinus sp.]|nr:hypothetical protein [Desulfosporosinus sp.]